MSNEPSFTGPADLHGFAALHTLPVKLSDVRFTDGAVTYWHSHEGGQVLVVVSGTGRYGERGGSQRPLAPGDVVVADPEVEHYHGAEAGASLRHIAISSGLTTWKGAPDEEGHPAATSRLGHASQAVPPLNQERFCRD